MLLVDDRLGSEDLRDDLIRVGVPAELSHRLATRCRVSDTGCWEWLGSSSKKMGYGHIWYDGRCWLVHRLVFHFAIHPVGVGRSGGLNCVLHHCDNPRCFNPRHLFYGAQADNVIDMCQKRRNRGVPGEANHKAKLTKQQVTEIRRLDKIMRRSRRRIGHMFGISGVQVGNICRERSWANAAG